MTHDRDDEGERVTIEPSPKFTSRHPKSPSGIPVETEQDRDRGLQPVHAMNWAVPFIGGMWPALDYPERYKTAVLPQQQFISTQTPPVACTCPPGANKDCESPTCPRKRHDYSNMKAT